MTNNTTPVKPAVHRKHAPATAKPLNSPPLRERRAPRDHNKRPDESTIAAAPQFIPTSPAKDSIRIIPLGGVEEVGKNMTLVEFRDEIVIIDAGFQFPGEEAPGVDYIIPDTTYLQKKKHMIKGVFITHGHLDHTGGIPYIMDKIGNPPIYTRLLSSVMIKKRQDEFPHLAPLKLHVIEKDSKLRVGKHLSVRFFNVTHTIPDAMGVIVETPYGNLVFTGDLKIDHDNGVPLPHEMETFEKLKKEDNLFLACDSTNVERSGWSFSERAVHENLRKIMTETKGRLIMGTFASLLERVIFVIKTAEEMGKKVLIRGRSMKNNVAIATEVQMLKVKPSTLITPEEAEGLPANKVIILATGAQGEELAALMRIATKKDKNIRMTKNDTVLLSSSIIPGNERSVQKLKDNISRQGAKIIHYRIADVHSSGHANHDETLWIHKMVHPKFFMPLHGHHYMHHVHAEIAREAGMQDDHIIIPDNGMVIDITEEGKKVVIQKEAAPSGIVMVDGLGTGDVKDVVIRDRQLLAEDGMFVIIGTVDIKTGKLRQSPDIISRGFIYLKESQDLLRQTRFLIKKTVEDATAEMHPVNFDYVKNHLREKIGKFLFQKTKKRPMILPVLIEV